VVNMTLMKSLGKEQQKRIVELINKDIELIDKEINLLKSMQSKLGKRKLFLKQVKSGQQSLENLLKVLRKSLGKPKQPVTWTEIDDWAQDLDSMCDYIEDNKEAREFLPHRMRDGSEFKELILRIHKGGLESKEIEEEH